MGGGRSFAVAALGIAMAGCSLLAGLDGLSGAGEDGAGGAQPGDAGEAGAPGDATVTTPDRYAFGASLELARGLAGPRGVALAGDAVYVTLYEGASVVAVPKAGGAVRALVDGGSGTPPLDVFATTTSVVWSNTNTSYTPLWTVPAQGGEARSLGQIPANAPMAVRAAEDPTSYYVTYQYFAQAGLARAQKSPSLWFSLATQESSSFQSVAADGVRVYVGAREAIFSTSTGGGQLELFAAGQASPVDIAVDDEHVYWLTASGAVARLAKAAKGAAPEILASGQPALARLALDGEVVHFTVGGSSARGGAVRSVPKRGGEVKELASGLAGPWGIAADASGVYVAVHDDGTVIRIPR